MSFQQQAGLHPFVYSVSVVEPHSYPDLSLSQLTSLTKPQMVLANDSNLYRTRTVIADDLTVRLQLTKLQRQDYHENYFVQELAVDHQTLLPVLNVNLGRYPNETTFIMDYKIKETLAVFGGDLYVSYNNMRGTQIIQSYKVHVPRSDLTLKWSYNTSSANVVHYSFHVTAALVYTYRIVSSGGISTLYVDTVDNITGNYNGTLFHMPVAADARVKLLVAQQNMFLVYDNGTPATSYINLSTLSQDLSGNYLSERSIFNL